MCRWLRAKKVVQWVPIFRAAEQRISPSSCEPDVRTRATLHLIWGLITLEQLWVGLCRHFSEGLKLNQIYPWANLEQLLCDFHLLRNEVL